MKSCLKFYIDGDWVDPIESRKVAVINPATEEAIGEISLGGPKDVDRAVKAARAAFPAYSATSQQQRVELLEQISSVYQKRQPEIAAAVSAEMGAPLWFAEAAQAATGMAHIREAIRILKDYKFEEPHGKSMWVKEPIGVCGLISPWNWPVNQIMCKVAPALAVGCTMVLKPTQIAPLNAIILAEVMDEAGVPRGVFNLVNGEGTKVGVALSAHPDIDMVSFTGSTRAGIEVAKAAADTVKRVAQELGGKSANIILDDLDAAGFQKAIKGGAMGCFMNSGQSCNAPTRMLVPASRQDEAIAVAKAVAEGLAVGDPKLPESKLGPVASQSQWQKIQALIERGIAEGAQLVAGGAGRPEGLKVGYYVRPTVFANVKNSMTIAQEEIFGPVLSIIPYKDEAEAIAIANDSIYGLSGYVSGGNIERARSVARKMRTGNVHLNGAGPDFGAPFGGYKQSGNGREWGERGFEEFLEVKALMGYSPA